MQNNPKIPEGWSVKKLKTCLSLLKDGTHGTHVDVSYGVILLSAKDVVNGQIIFSEEARKISLNDFNSLHKNYHIQNDDVVLTIVGTIGRCAIIKNYDNNYTFQRSVAILRPNKEITSKYLFSYIQGDSFQKELLKRQSISAQPGVYLDDLSKISLLLPPLPEQEKIALVLGMWDEAIEKLSDLIEQKKLLKKGLMQELLTGKTRLPGFTQPWKEVKLGSVLESISRRNKNLNTTRVLSVTNSRGFVLPEEQFARVVASEDLSNYKIVKKGEFAYNPSRLNVGSIDRLDNFTDGVLSPMYVIFKCNEQLLSDYMKHWITTTEFNSKVRNSAQGSVRETVDFKTLSTIKIRLPSDITEQQAIADVLSTADDEINLLNQKLKAIKEQKKGLMQQLLTGQIRAKVN